MNHKKKTKKKLILELDVAQAKKVQNKIKLKFASWNFRTMLDQHNADRPEQRSAIISLNLANYDIDIAASSEVRFPGTAYIKEKTGYSINWSSKMADERGESGVALAIKTKLICQNS